MASDDPELQAAMTRYAERGRPGPLHVVLTMALLLVHAAMFLAWAHLIAFSAMTTDPCAYVACGDEQWINRAVALAWYGGAAVVALDLAVVVWRLVRRGSAIWAPLLGCTAQFVLIVVSYEMVGLAGPLS